MFRIHIAKVYGFCRGVEIAVALATGMLDESDGRPVYSIGKLVHNDSVVRHFEERGLRVISSPEGNEPGTALIRAHGITEAQRRAFIDAGFTLVDGTCKIVLANHTKCMQSKRPILYFGINGHAETISTVDSIKTDYLIIENEEDLDKIDPTIKWNAVVQTTFSSSKVALFREKLKERGVDAVWLNSVCSASIRRREAVTELCAKCPTILVIGERQSANTTELYRLALSLGAKAYFVPTENDIEDEMLDCEDIGICAGASVAPQQVALVVKALEERGGTLIGKIRPSHG